MKNIDLRPSLRIVQHIAFIERFCGSWSRLRPSGPSSGTAFDLTSLIDGTKSNLSLDSSSPAPLHFSAGTELNASLDSDFDVLRQRTSRVGDPLLENLAELHLVEASFNAAGINELHRRLMRCLVMAGSMSAEPATVMLGEGYRNHSLNFITPEKEVVFPAVSAFVIDARLQELVDWVNNELDAQAVNPLLVIGVFHLLFLQVSPFSSANHHLCLLLVWRLLDALGYDFVRARHPSLIFLERAKQYFFSLRQAEKTSFSGNWSTLNIWLEFLLECLGAACAQLRDSHTRSIDYKRLTSVQQSILRFVREHGAATREHIANTTGINLSTVKYNLSILAARGYLKRHGGGRTTSYSIE